MLGVSFVLLYLAIVKGFEPLLLMPIAFGMLLANLPAAGMMAPPTVEIDAVTGREKPSWAACCGTSTRGSSSGSTRR